MKILHSTFLAIIAAVLALAVPSLSSARQVPGDRLLVASGLDAGADLSSLINLALEKNPDTALDILLLPVAYPSDASLISEAELLNISERSENIRLHVESTCARLVPSGSSCEVTLAPYYTRPEIDAQVQLLQTATFPDLVLILGDNPSIAMEIIGGTGMEEYLSSAYRDGTIIAALGKSSALFGLHMLDTDQQDDFAPRDVFRFGEVQVYGSAEKHGLIFGLPQAMIIDNIYSTNQIGSLLNALSLPESPSIGIGYAPDTILVFKNTHDLEQIAGQLPYLVLDTGTYQAKKSVAYRSEPYSANDRITISIQNVLVHLLAKTDTYTLCESPAGIDPPPTTIMRSFPALDVSPTAGHLYLSGNIVYASESTPIFKQFTLGLEAGSAPVLLITSGYENPVFANRVISRNTNQMDIPVEVFNIDSDNLLELPDFSDYAALILAVGEIGSLPGDLLIAVEQAWSDGMDLFLQDEIAGYFGQLYISRLTETILPESAAVLTHSPAETGTGKFPFSLEPNLNLSGGWQRLFSLAAASPGKIALGLPAGTALEVSPEGLSVIGENPAVVLDLRRANFSGAAGSSYSFANGLLDLIAPGESVEFALADQNADRAQVPTPLSRSSETEGARLLESQVATATPGLTATPLPGAASAARTPRPTPTPLSIPPPTDPATTHWIVAFGVFIVIIILFGILLNYNRLR